MQREKLFQVSLIILTWSLLLVSPIHAQGIQDSAMCIGYGSDLQPRGIGNTVFQYTDKIGLWVKIQDPTDVSYRVVWEDPSGSQFRNSATNITPKAGEDWGIIFDSIEIADSTAKNKLGVWTVYLYEEGEIVVESQFQIINYAALVDSISDLQVQIEDIVEEKDNLSEQNAALEASLESLQADYAALQSQVGTSSDYEQLQDKYDELLDDYSALKDRQGTTQIMLYVSIIVALVAVAIGVYLGFMKK